MEKASLEDVLAYREKRVRRRNEILLRYPFPLACLSLNIPGERKDFPWARRAFREEVDYFLLSLEAEGLPVLYKDSETESAGYTAYISVDAAAEQLKAAALRMEETHALGRLFDADIYNPKGEKLSREDRGGSPRPCLVCGGNGFSCARSRAHTLEDLRSAVLKIVENWLRQTVSEKITSAAMWAMINEAAITPKPGLVDRANSGSHKDMDFFAFINSAAALLPWFGNCARAGFDSGAAAVEDGRDESSFIEEIKTAAEFPAARESAFFSAGASPGALFESLRPPGRIAEALMKKAAGGVNTHRGYIFCLGLLSAAYGRIYRITEKPGLPEMLEFARAMTLSLKNDFSLPPGNKASHGETVYAKSGIQGIRGEAARGFPSVEKHALPLLRRLLREGNSINDAGIAVLLKLMAHAEDTNIIHRGGEKVFRAIQEELRAFFGANPGIEAVREKAAAMDREFIARNLSPGGSADLLGTPLFLYGLLEGRF